MKLLPNNIEPDEYLGKGLEYLFIGVLFIIIIFCLTIYAIFSQEIALGELGSFLSGSVGSLIALLAAFFTFLAFYVQYDANKRIQQQFKVQQFESQFYKLLDIHVLNIKDFGIRNYNINSKTHVVTRGETKGRRVFLPMIKEFHYLLTILHSFYKSENLEKRKKINAIAYNIFFYGIESNHLKGLDSDDKIIETIKSRLLEFQKRFRDSQSKQRSIAIPPMNGGAGRNQILEIKLRYVPFCGHEMRLAHYYRHLYQSVKLVDQALIQNLISYTDSRRYLASLRAQLSNQEQLLLYYNYLCGEGNAWDKLGGKHRFLSFHRMIHNIPLDDERIHNSIENPRDHFEDYISEFGTFEDPIFEWGDQV